MSPLFERLGSASFLEYAFLRWVLAPAVDPRIESFVCPQREVDADGHAYRIDYAIETARTHLAIELDGFEFHGNRTAFSYDRLRQNDLLAAGWEVLRFSYDSIRVDTARCVAQLQAVLGRDPELAALLVRPPLGPALVGLRRGRPRSEGWGTEAPRCRRERGSPPRTAS